MVDKLKGFFLVLLVVLLSAVFALQFGGGQAEGCASGGSTYLARVYGQTLSRGDFEAAYDIANFGRLPEATQRIMRLQQFVLDGLVDRALLARRARELGIEVNQDEVMDHFVNDGVILLTLGVGAPSTLPQGEIPVSFAGEDGVFNKELAERYIQNGLRRSIAEFADAQTEEHLAARMRKLVESMVAVSDQEAWENHARENDLSKIKYVRFAPAFYAEHKPQTTPQALQAWIAANQDRLDAEYEANKHRYINLESQVHARHILVGLGSDATEEQKVQAEKKAKRLQRRAAQGEDFAQLARNYSTDTATAKNGGDLGFVQKGTRPEPFDHALFAMSVGDVSEVVQTQYGFHVIKVLAIREGNVPVEEAKQELATDLYQADWLQARAWKAATNALKLWRQSNNDDALSEQLGAAAKGRDSSSLAPTLQETDFFGRSDSPLPGISTTALLNAVFALPNGDEFPPQPLELGGEWIIFRLVDRQRPDKQTFHNENVESTRKGLEALKKKEAVDLYIQKLRDQAVADNALRIRPIETRAQR